MAILKVEDLRCLPEDWNGSWGQLVEGSPPAIARHLLAKLFSLWKFVAIQSSAHIDSAYWPCGWTVSSHLSHKVAVPPEQESAPDAPHVDVAFDQGLITFGASGELVISPMLSVEDAQRLNLDVASGCPKSRSGMSTILPGIVNGFFNLLSRSSDC